MRTAVLLALLAFAAAANASRVNVLRSLLTDDKYCKDHNGHSDCPEYHECQKLEKKVCTSKPVCHTGSYGEKKCRYEE
ncbi:unnamed protein product, partial [Ostreobium quekettii]